MTAVSVVMPVRNEERSVAGAVRSVLAQSVADVELLVVDGASSDGTLAQVQRIAADEPRVRVLSNPEQTIPHALNIGLAAARGRYLARVDAHASVNDSYLERGIRALDDDPRVAAVGGRRIGVAQTRSGVAVATALSSRFGVGDSINHYAQVAQDTDHASFGVFRVEVLKSVGGWDENLLVNEDVDIDHRILAAGHRIRFDPQMCIYWHVRESVPALARQYRRYGRGKAAMVRKNGRGAIRVRHLAPPALVVALAGAAGAAVAGFWAVAVALAAPYAVALTGATVATLRSSDPVGRPGESPAHPSGSGPPPFEALTTPAGGSATARSGGDRSGESADTGGDATPGFGRRAGAFRLVGAFLAMHLGWGLGFLEGSLFRLRPAASSARPPRAPRRTQAQRVRSAGSAAEALDRANQQVTGADSGRSSSGF